MQGETQSGMPCVEVEALLAEALDGSLQGPALAAFQAHEQSCAACHTMVQEARAGMRLLQALDEAEPPRNLVHNILAATIGALPSEHAMPAPRREGWWTALKGRLAPVFAPLATPRFAMSFGMAFFSITMLLGIAGFHFADVRHWDLTSRGIRRTYYETQARVMRYYENMRLVYEIESRVRDLRRAGTPDNNQNQQQQEAPAPTPAPKNPSKSDNRQQHDRQHPNYSRDEGGPELAAFPAAAAVIGLPVSLKGHTFTRGSRQTPYLRPLGWTRRTVATPYSSERVSLKGHAFTRGPRQTPSFTRRTVTAPYSSERALGREMESATLQARRQVIPQGCLNRRTA